MVKSLDVFKSLILTDLDGTLLSSEQKISDYSAEVINKLIESGMLFTYATARSFSSAGKITGRLNIKLPVATYNGAFLVDHATGKVLEACLLDKEQIEPILAALEDEHVYPLVYAFVDGQERISWIEGSETAGIVTYLNSRKGDKRQRPVSSYKDLFLGDIFHMTIIGTKTETEALRPIFNANKHIYYHILEDVYSSEHWLEVIRHDATKEQAALKLKKFVGAEKIISFGDNVNDIPMFKVSDECYAVLNAKDELKNIATDIIESNNENGVAKFLEKLYKNDCNRP